MTKVKSAKEKAENLVATFGPPVTKGIELRGSNEKVLGGIDLKSPSFGFTKH
jgi:hypothetical protein